MNRVGERVGVDAEEIFEKDRQKKRPEARGLFCYWFVNELGISRTELSRRLKMTVSGVGYAVTRGEGIARNGKYRLVGH